MMFKFTGEQWAALARHLPPCNVDVRRLIEREIWRTEAVEELCREVRSPRYTSLSAKAKRSPLERVARLTNEVAAAMREAAALGIARPEDAAAADQQAAKWAREAETMAKAVEIAATIPEPWPAIVQELADILREAGLQPTANGRAYEGAEPSWFQRFMLDLNGMLPEKIARPPATSNGAFYAAVGKALRSGD